MEASDTDEIFALSCILIGYGLKLKTKYKQRRNRRVWVKEWLMQRSEEGSYNNIVQELRLWDSAGYRRFMRMNSETFEVHSYFLFIYLQFYKIEIQSMR